MKAIMMQLAFNFAGYDEPNASGVYDGCECIELKRKSGPAIAEVRIANTNIGFLWGVSLRFPTGGHCYMPKIGRGDPQPTRAGAIHGACAELLGWLSSNSYARGAEAAAARGWAKSLEAVP